ncbi:MAG: type II toxin-antitoxin system RelB/DinJ family antitoxin [Sulfurimonas sp.]|jgi:DNA-damage-inducible protein J
MKQTTSIKLDPTVKQEAQEIFAQLGLTLGEAVNIFLNQVRLRKGIPFEINIPNKETLEALEDCEANRNMKSITFEQLQEEMKQCIVK